MVCDIDELSDWVSVGKRRDSSTVVETTRRFLCHNSTRGMKELLESRGFSDGAACGTRGWMDGNIDL